MGHAFLSASPAETRRLGERLGRLLQAGDVVLLEGPLGAGKTALVQGIARGLEVPRGRRIVSPTFALIHEHPGRVPLVHVDLYRVEEPGELEEIGLPELLGGAGAAVIEWASRLGPLAPPDRLEITIAPEGGRRRRLTVTAHGPRAAALAQALTVPLPARP